MKPTTKAGLDYYDLKTISEQCLILIWKTDTNLAYTFFNDAFFNFIGKKIKSNSPISWTQNIHPEDLELRESTFIKSFKTKKSYQLKYRLKKQNLKYHWILEKGVPNYTKNGDFKGFLGTCFDITEHELIERSKTSVYEELETSQQAVSLGSWYADMRTKQVKWSKELFQIFGFGSRKTPPSYTEYKTIFAPSSWESLATAHTLSKEGIPYDLELQTIKNNTKGWLWVKGEAVYDDGNNIIALRGIAQDITKRKLIELELQEAKDKAILNTKILSIKNDALHIKERILEQAGKIAKVGAWEYDVTGNKLTWSKTTYEIHEVPKDYVPDPGKGISFYKEGYCRNKITVAFTKLIKEGTSFDEELLFITYRGKEIWVRAIGIAEMKKGKCVRAYGVFQDVNTAKRRVEKLSENSKKVLDYQYALNQAAIISTTNTKGEIIYCNKNFCKISKYSKEELIGSNHNIINSGYHTRAFWIDLWQTIAKGKVWKGEIKNKAKDGSFYWVNTFIVPFKNNAGNIKQYMAIRYEITEKKKKEIELTLSKENTEEVKARLLLASKAAQLGIWDWDINKNELIWDDRMYELFDQKKGYKNNTLNLWSSSIHPDDKEKALEELDSSLKGSKEFDTSFRIMHQSGKTIYIKADAIVLRDKKGKPTRMIGVNYDITETKVRQVMLEDKNKQLIDFSNIVAHNLRAPLVNIEMLADLLKNTKDIAEQNLYVDKLKNVITHLNEVFNELIESLQIRQDGHVKIQKINLKRQLNKILKGFQTQIETHKADIKINFESAPTIYFPTNYIDSIFSNLISNALKYKSPTRKPIIKIESKQDTEGILITVEDNGLGIDMNLAKDHLFKIRKTFHNHPEAKGFGLFMIKTQIEAMNGKIWIDSTPNEGSTFYIKLKHKK
ncbi:MAG: PAS domain-containing protein [Jejuia sp.]